MSAPYMGAKHAGMLTTEQLTCGPDADSSVSDSSSDYKFYFSFLQTTHFVSCGVLAVF